MADPFLIFDTQNPEISHPDSHRSSDFFQVQRHRTGKSGFQPDQRTREINAIA